MLIRFNVKNFLSFSEREDKMSEEFSMIAGKVRNKKEHVYDDGKIKLLKFAAIYGANASGKSNFVKALEFMKRTILFGLPEGHMEKYCKIDIKNKDKASYFELEIMLDNKYYTYGFEVILNQSRFVSEWLIEIVSNDKENLIFSRDITKGIYEFGEELKVKGLIEKLDVYAEDMQRDDSVLLLSLMNQNKKTLYQQFEQAAIFRNIYIWIDKCLNINYPDKPISDYSYLAKTENVEKICNIMSAFGTGITNFRMIEIPIEKVLGNLSKESQEYLTNYIEESIVYIRNSIHTNNVGIIMRSNHDFLF